MIVVMDPMNIEIVHFAIVKRMNSAVVTRNVSKKHIFVMVKMIAVMVPMRIYRNVTRTQTNQDALAMNLHAKPIRNVFNQVWFVIKNLIVKMEVMNHLIATLMNA